ncbi:MAG: glycosyltransferase family 2 protein [Terriglobia bacterium]
MKISATIVALNEELNIARAIESIRCVDEILVIDSGSSDGTREVAARLGARVIVEPWRGYAAQKNFASECALHPWILSLDADEAVSEELEAEVLELRRSGPQVNAYSMPRMAQYLGRWIRHSGWYPDRKVRLFERAHGQWVGRFVHESVRVAGTTGALKGNLLHFTCDSLSAHMASVDRYTTLAAQELRADGTRVGVRRIAFDPAWTFVRTYLIQRGFLDGSQGFAIAWMAALYTFLKYAKARDADSASR